MVEREQRRRRGDGGADCGAGRTPAVLVARRLLQLREALEAQGLREPDDGAGRGAGAARELLRGLKSGLVEVVDDVLRHVLLGARELVETRLDVGGESLTAARHLWRLGGNRCVLHAAASDSTLVVAVPSSSRATRLRAGVVSATALLILSALHEHLTDDVGDQEGRNAAHDHHKGDDQRERRS